MSQPRRKALANYRLAADLLDDVRGRGRAQKAEHDAERSLIGAVEYYERWGDKFRPVFGVDEAEILADAVAALHRAHRGEFDERFVRPDWIWRWDRELSETIGRIVLHCRVEASADPIFDRLRDVADEIRHELGAQGNAS